MKSTDSEPQGGGMELEQYRTSLEQMVEEKSKDLIAIQENLEATNRRQALFIKVLQILQLEPDIPTAMNMALAEIGRYTGVDVWRHGKTTSTELRMAAPTNGATTV